jgi:hypothetical protein
VQRIGLTELFLEKTKEESADSKVNRHRAAFPLIAPAFGVGALVQMQSPRPFFQWIIEFVPNHRPHERPQLDSADFQ